MSKPKPSDLIYKIEPSEEGFEACWGFKISRFVPSVHEWVVDTLPLAEQSVPQAVVDSVNGVSGD